MQCTIGNRALQPKVSSAVASLDYAAATDALTVEISLLQGEKFEVGRQDLLNITLLM